MKGGYLDGGQQIGEGRDDLDATSGMVASVKEVLKTN